ncbi:hypothetical protein KIF59_18130 [Enterobacter cloacae subsp. cloacae]|nr:hypothetical protein [Enterobacter cloacae subsp. cloacae]
MSSSLPLLDETDEPMDDEKPDRLRHGFGAHSGARRWRKVHGDIDFVMLAKIRPSTHWWRYSPRGAVMVLISPAKPSG